MRCGRLTGFGAVSRQTHGVPSTADVRWADDGGDGGGGGGGDGGD